MMTKPARNLGAAVLLLALAACSQTSQQQQEPAPTPVADDSSEETLTVPVAVVTEDDVSRPVKKKPTASSSERPVAAVTDKPFVPKAPGLRVFQVSVPGPYVALTFDDGPHASYTPQVLDILKRHGAHATFFVLGSNASRHPGILARAAAEGHEIGSHTWSHINMSRSSTEKIFSELDRTNAAIESATGKAPRVMRPPYGSAGNGLVRSLYNRYGTPAILWDVDTEDWRHPGVSVVVDRAVSKAKPGSIILVHDIHASTLAAVEGIVTGLQARGYKLVTVSQLMELGRRAAGASAPARQTETAGGVPAEATTAPLPASPLPEAGAGASGIGTAPQAAENESAATLPGQGAASISAGEPEF